MSGKISNSGITALIWLFYGKPEKTNFGSNSFKLLWEKEKDINLKELKYLMNKRSMLKIMITTAVPDAIDYYDNELSNSSN